MAGENEIKIDVWARPWYSVPLQVISFRLFWLNALDHPQTVHPGADCLSNNTVRTNTMRSSDLPLCLSPCCSPCVPAELIAPLISVKTFTLKVGRLAQNLWQETKLVAVWQNLLFGTRYDILGLFSSQRLKITYLE